MEFLSWIVFLLVSAFYKFFPEIVFLIIGFVLMNAVRRSRAAVWKGVLFVYLAAPLPFWLSSYFSAKAERSNFEQQVAEIQTVPFSGPVPRVLLFDGPPGKIAQGWLNEIACNPENRPNGRLLGISEEQISGKPSYATLPSEYLLLTYKRFTKPVEHRGHGQPAIGPFRLEYVKDGARSLIGFQYEPYLPLPFFPPILTKDGWLSFPAGSKAEHDVTNIVEFLRTSLGGCADLDGYLVDTPSK